MQHLTKKIFATLCCALFLYSMSPAEARTYKVLFIGNSYVYTNDLPGMLRTVAASMGDTLLTTSVSPGGFTLAGHWGNTASLAAISQTGWDFVIFQAQSQEPSFSPAQVQSQTLPFAKSLDSLSKATNPCAEVMYFMTWGRKYGDAANCVNYPVICTYDGMQGRLRDSYVQMATDNKSSVCPVGQVWRSVRQQDSTIELYVSDQSHPSVNGTYVAACSFYISMLHRRLNSNSFVPTGVDASDASLIRNTAASIVLDSIETWQGAGGMPLAQFTISNAGLTVTATNTSKRNTACDLYWGDGSSTLNNCGATLQHTYTNAGTYNINLVVKDSCGSTDTSLASVSVQLNTNISSNAQYVGQVIKLGSDLRISNADGAVLKVYSVQGALVLQSEVTSSKYTCAVPAEHGVLIYRLHNTDGSMLSGLLR
jgi:hypothetical protein